MKIPGLIDGLYKGRSIGVDGQELVNFYAQLEPSENAKNRAVLYGTPGLKYLASLGSGKCRGIYVTARDRCLAVISNKLIEILPSWSYNELATLETSSGRVAWAEMDVQPDPVSAPQSKVMIVDGLKGYIFDTLTSAITTITGDYFPGTSIISQNGFFVQNTNDNNKFIYSNYLAGSWEASLNFFAAESNPDPINYLTLLNNQLWLFGSKSIEIWNFTGNSDQLWNRSGIGFIMTGIAGRYCATQILGSVFWLGSDKDGQNIVWQSGGSYTPQRISTHAIEYIIGGFGQTNDCVALSYQQEGHAFVIFNFPSANRTLCYDISTQIWHERGDYNSLTGLNDRHRAMFTVNFANKILVGDDANSNLYEWSLDQYTDNGKTIKRVRVCPHMHAERRRIRYNQLELDMERGVGLQDTTATLATPPVADFTAVDIDSTECTGPWHWRLTNTSTGDPDIFRWNIPSDMTTTDDTCSAGPIDIQWPDYGTYTVSLYVRNRAGSDSTARTLYSEPDSTSAPSTPPTAVITWSNETLPENMTYGPWNYFVSGLDSTPVDGIATWSWSVNNGAFITSGEDSMTNIQWSGFDYSTYTVTLTVTNGDGTDSTSVVIDAEPPPP